MMSHGHPHCTMGFRLSLGSPIHAHLMPALTSRLLVRVLVVLSLRELTGLLRRTACWLGGGAAAFVVVFLRESDCGVGLTESSLLSSLPGILTIEVIAFSCCGLAPNQSSLWVASQIFYLDFSRRTMPDLCRTLVPVHSTRTYWHQASLADTSHIYYSFVEKNQKDETTSNLRWRSLLSSCSIQNDSIYITKT